MKCGSASPFSADLCQLERGHEGPHFDGDEHWTGSYDAVGRDLIQTINKTFNLSIEMTEENAKKMSAVVDDNIDSIMEANELGNCSDCEERMPDEPTYNEGYL